MVSYIGAVSMKFKTCDLVQVAGTCNFGHRFESHAMWSKHGI